MPTDIIKDIEKQGRWKEMTGQGKGSSQAKPGPSRQQKQVPGPSSAPNLPPRDEPVESAPSEEDEAQSAELLLAKLCREGGVQLVDLLLSKALPTIDNGLPDGTNPREWTFRDILKLPKKEQEEWMAACREELEALRKRKVYELVDRPNRRKVTKNRWVFDVKTDGRKKARLVAKGYSQIEGLDYDQVFSPVVRFETVRLILALAALEDMHVSGLDVRNAYLYGKLDEEIYMEQPEGFKVPGQEHKVYRLLRALYGLKQAGLAWWRTLNESLKELGCKRLVSDAGIFVYRTKDGRFVLIIVYVDDAIFCGKDKALVLELKQRFMKKWECRDLGDVKEFLRMRITRKGSEIHLDQCAYLEKVLQRCGMQNAHSAPTPLPAGYKPAANTGAVSPALRTKYQTVIGSLLYLMLGTRPDICYAVTLMAQFAANPTEDHLNRALYICRYLIGTKSYALVYQGQSGNGLMACTDSDWADSPEARKSRSGYFMKFANGAFSWLSRRQKTVALSSTEAEYMSLSDCSRQVAWIKMLLEEIGYKLGPLPICSDNQGAIFISSNPVTERRSKHIDIRYHYIRELIEDKKVKVFYISTDENPADLFTKNLGRIKFLKFRGMLGLRFYD